MVIVIMRTTVTSTSRMTLDHLPRTSTHPFHLILGLWPEKTLRKWRDEAHSSLGYMKIWSLRTFPTLPISKSRIHLLAVVISFVVYLTMPHVTGDTVDEVHGFVSEIRMLYVDIEPILS